MWPYSTSSSRVMGVPTKLKLHINLDDFAKSDKVFEATLTSDIWAMVEWLGVTTDSTNTDVIKSLLFQALYGRIAYEQLLEHVRQQQHVEELKKQARIDEFEIAEKEGRVVHLGEALFSRDRVTSVDLEHIGKANVNRKLLIPLRMWNDLDRQSAKAGIDRALYVRGLLFKVLQGEVNYNQWQQARAELENQPKPPYKI
jgi:hypothetical protein